MKARLIKSNADNSMMILCDDGTIAEVTHTALTTFLLGFQKIDELHGELGYWVKEYPDMYTYPGKTLAYVTDSFTLIVEDITPFKLLFNFGLSTTIENLVTASEYAAMHGKSVEQIKIFCRNNRIAGAKKFGRDWVIPKDAPYPLDERISSGNYVKRK